MHAVPPSESWYVPAVHLMQVDCSELGLYVPGAQLVGVEEPTGQKEPAPQITQSSRVLRKPSRASTAWSAWRPPGHGCGALAPSTHRYPVVQGRHCV